MPNGVKFIIQDQMPGIFCISYSFSSIFNGGGHFRIMNERSLTSLANVFLGLSDKTRLRLIQLLSNGEVSVGYLAHSLGESQPKTSRHLAYLRNCGLVTTRREGKWIYYYLEPNLDPVSRSILDATIRSITSHAEDAKSSASPSIHEDSKPDSIHINEHIFESAYISPFQQPSASVSDNELPIFLL